MIRRPSAFVLASFPPNTNPCRNSLNRDALPRNPRVAARAKEYNAAKHLYLKSCGTGSYLVGKTPGQMPTAGGSSALVTFAKRCWNSLGCFFSSKWERYSDDLSKTISGGLKLLAARGAILEPLQFVLSKSFFIKANFVSKDGRPDIKSSYHPAYFLCSAS